MIIFGSPARYVQGAGALSRLGQEIRRFGMEVTLILDPLIQDRYGESITASCDAAGLKSRQLRFGGDCTATEVDRLEREAGPVAVVAAAGGGKCIDAGKALAKRTGAIVVTIPTIASTDAPTSHNYVMYDDDHRLVAVEKLTSNPALVIVDTAVIAQAPKRLFVAGIGDAIGKIYETEACAAAKGQNVFGGLSAWTAVTLGRACHALLLEHTPDALLAIERQEPDEALERVVEATVLMSGLAFESGGLSISHSMTRGLTAVKPYADTLHGFQVAYANLVQLHLEGRSNAEIDALAGFYLRTGLPRSLEELAAHPTGEQIEVIASRTMTAPHIRHFPRELAVQDIAHSIQWVEARFGAQKP